MAVLDGQAAHGEELVGTALGKVVRALPAGVARQAAILREHASTVPHRHPVRPDPAVTCALVAASAVRRRVLLRYRSGSGHESEADVDPWSVVVRHGRWYLLCHSHRADATRAYRVDRIQAVEQTEHGFVMPDGLDPVATLEEHLGAGWPFATRVVFDAPRDVVAPWIRPPLGRLEAWGDGCVLVGSTNNPAMYAQEWLACLPFAFKVEGGAELREAVSTLAARLGAAVADLPGDPP
jgi:hypothetical protein